METEVIPVLRVADAAAAVAWYERLGFAEQWVHAHGPSEIVKSRSAAHRSGDRQYWL